jgi:predicted DsbA family dithiol-disulfide isomerase
VAPVAKLSDSTPVPPLLQVRVYYDFASTLAYVAHRVMERMAPDLDELGLALDWQPLDLTLITGWPRGVVVEGPRRANALRVATEMGVPVRMPGVWLDSRAAHAVALSLGSTSKAAAWRERVWSAIHEEGRDPEDTGELARLAADLDVTLPDPLDDPTLAEETRRAVAAGVTGVPAFLLDAFVVPGIQTEETMRLLLRRFVSRRAARE